MQKRFNYLPFLVFSLINTMPVKAAEEQIKKMVKLKDNTVWHIQGPRSLCESISKGLCQKSSENQQGVSKKVSIPLTKGGVLTASIGEEGRVTVNGNKRQGCLCIKDPLGRVIFDSKKQKKIAIGSLEEDENDDNDEKKDDEEDENDFNKSTQLQIGGSITVGPYLDSCGSPSNIIFSYDKQANIVCKDGIEVPVLLSLWRKSKLVSLATSSQGMKFRRTEDKGKVFLEDDSKEKIELIDEFLKCDSEGRKKLSKGLSIVIFTRLLGDLDKHCLVKACGFDYFDEARALLENQVYDSLVKVAKLDVSCWPDAIKWLKEVKKWPLRERNIMEDILRRVIRPIPNIFLSWDSADNLKLKECYNANKMIVARVYRKGKGEVKNLITNEVLLKVNNVKDIFFDKTGTIVTICYYDGSKEVRHLKVDNGEEKVIVSAENALSVHANVDDMINVILYKNGKVKVTNFKKGYEWEEEGVHHLCLDKFCKKFGLLSIEGDAVIFDLENEKELFRKDINDESDDVGVSRMCLSGLGEVAAIIYDDSCQDIIDLETEEVLLKGEKVEDTVLSSTNRIAAIKYLDSHMIIIDLKTKEILGEHEGVSNVTLSETGKIAVIKYKDDHVEIRDVKRGIVLYEGYNVDEATLDLSGSRAIICFKDKKRIALDLSNYNRDLVFTTLKPEELILAFGLRYSELIDDVIKCFPIWQSLNVDLKQKIEKSYLSKKSKEVMDTL